MLNKTMTCRLAALGVACSVFAPAFAQAGPLDLSRYSLTGTYSAGIHEASGVTYNWDTDTLFVVSDSVNIVERGKNGQHIPGTRQAGTAGSGNAAFKDTEGIAYIGNGQYLLADERAQTVSLVTAMQHPFGGPNDILFTSKPQAPTYTFGATSPNIGIEGVAYERSTGTIFAIKEFDPQGIYQASISFGATTATTTGSHFELFDPALLGLITLSDISLLSNVEAFAGSDFEQNLLILSATSELLLEVTRSGEIVSSLSLAGMADKIEGVTIDNDGIIYLVSEGPGIGGALLVLSPALVAVPEPSVALLMLGGLAAMGAGARRRHQDPSSAPTTG